MRLFYCAFESIFDPVFDSQVLKFLEKINFKLEKKDQEINLVIFGSIGDLFKKGYWCKRREIKKLLKNKCFISFKLPYFYRFPFIFKFSLFLNSVICLLVFLFIFSLKRSTRAIVHCRTEVASFILLKIKKLFYRNIRIICDCRGIGSKEILYKYSKNNSLFLSKKIEEVERLAQRNSDYVFCVSNSFKDFIQKHNEGKIKKINTIPCCVDINRFKYDPPLREQIRKEMNVDSKFVVLYSGSLNEWQLPLEMIKIFKIFKKNIKESIFVLFTKDIEYAKKLFLNSGLGEESYIVSYKPYSIINKYLLLGDLGLLIREKNDVNNVAFPVKFLEYVRCGVPVLSSITSDVADMIDRFKLGYRLNNYDDLHEIEKIALNIKSNILYLKSDEYKNKISSIVRKKADWDYYTDRILRIYKSLLLDN